jgi:hypothetical protein
MLPRLWAHSSTPDGQDLILRMTGDEHLTAMEVSRRPESGDTLWCWALVVSQAEGCATWIATLTTVSQPRPEMGRQMIIESASGSTAEGALKAALEKHVKGAKVGKEIGVEVDDG